MPMPRDRPPRLMMFRSRPVKYIMTTANSTDRGMLTPTTRVGLTSFRNSARIRMASTAPWAMLDRMLEIRMVI